MLQIKCARMEDWGEVCVYDSACFDGEIWHLFSDNPDKHHHPYWAGVWPVL